VPNEKKKRFLSLSVHQLVDFLLRTGDIDNRVYNQETMQAGTRIHASFQQKQGRDYASEYPLAEVFERPLGIIHLEGRADGIITGGPFPVIDEIKSTVIPVEEFHKQQGAWHLGQAQCYALMYCHEKKIDKIGVRLTYLSQVNDDKAVHEATYSVEDLEKAVYGYMDEYLSFYQGEFTHIDERNASALAMKFPYSDFRPGQRDMARYVYSVATKGGTFYCEAPTGIGKTMSTLFPAIKAFGSSNNEKIFYLTAKSTGAESAYDALGMLYKKGFKGRDSLLVAKDKLCFKPGAACNPDECPFAKDYYTKIRKVVLEAIHSGERFDQAYVTSLAKKYAICPFEMQLDLSLYSDIVIGDFNYVYDPLVHLERFFDPPADPSRSLLLVDEAHNLVERGRDMYSSTLTLSDAIQARRSLRKAKVTSVKRALGKIEQFFLDEANGYEGGVLDYESAPDTLVKALASLSRAHKELLKKAHPSLGNSYKDFSRECHRFEYLLGNYPEHSRIYFEKRQDRAEIHLYCLDPSEYLASSASLLKGRVYFSATLSPIDYYEDALSGQHDYPSLLLPSPFPKENFDLILAPLVSTRFKDRASTYQEVADYLSAFVEAKKGNYFLYFPSYEYLENILPLLSFKDADVLKQDRDMTTEEKAAFLDKFVPKPKKTTVALLIIGGTFSEGIDLVGDRLNGVAVVGIGLPQLSHERDLIRDYYDKINQEGYAYAYMNPGMNKVMQAVGRLIRSEKDHGAALLIDDRYLTEDYKKLFERTWTGYAVATKPDDVKENLLSFYKKKHK
jgi:DNA excision repair protein ERCC-2